jgi:precorrin-4 methylase
MSALVETYMTSVERILHYANNLDSEDDEDTTVKVIPNTPWPDKAAIAVSLYPTRL